METMAQQRRDEEEICEVITVQADSEREKGREWCGRGESERDAEWDEGDGVGPARWESERRANPSSPAVRRRACEVPFDALPINWTSTLTLLRSTRTHSLTGFAGVSRVKAGRGYVYAATCRTPVDRALRRLGSYRDVRTAALAVALAAAEPTIGSRPALAREWIERIGAGEPPPALTRVNTLSSSSTNAIMPLKSVVALTAGPSSEEVEAMAATEGLCLARDSRSLSGFRGVRRRVQANGEARFAARLTGAACGERHLGIHATAELAALEVARAQREEKRERRVLSLLRCSVACPAENVAFNRYETISSLKDARGNSTERFRKSPMQKHILVERRCWTSQELQQLRRLVEDQRPNRQDEGDRAILGSNDSNGESISVLSSKFWVQIANHHRSLSGIHRSPAAIRQRFRRMVHSAVVPPMPPLVV